MMALTNEDLDAIRKIVDDRAVQTEKLISMSFAQLRFQLTGPHNNIQQNNPWGDPNSQGFGWSAPNPLMQIALNNSNNEFGTAFRKLASVEGLKESDFPEDLIYHFNEAFGSVIKFADFIKLSVAERTETMSSKLNPIIMSKAKEQMEKAGLTMSTSPDLFGGKDAGVL
jgi:hypothetical protein